MNWLQFLTYIIGGYLFYYLINIFIDIGFSSTKDSAKPETKVLTFQEAFEPVKIETPPADMPANPEPLIPTEPAVIPPVKKEPVIIGSGGLSLKDFFNVARQEAILYTRPVSF